MRDVSSGTFAPNAFGESCFEAKMCLTIRETDAELSTEEAGEE